MMPDDKDVRAELMRLVPQVAREGRMIVEAIAEQQDLHHTDVEALSRIMLGEVQGSPLTAGDLGQALGLTSGATTFVMTRLEGLVRRERDAQDQRKVRLHLSTAGHDLAQAIYPPVLELSDAVMDTFCPADLEVVRRFLAATATAMATYRQAISSAPLPNVRADTSTGTRSK